MRISSKQLGGPGRRLSTSLFRWHCGLLGKCRIIFIQKIVPVFQCTNNEAYRSINLLNLLIHQRLFRPAPGDVAF